MKTTASPKRRSHRPAPLSPLLERALVEAVAANERKRVAYTLPGIIRHFRGAFPASEVRQAIQRLNRSGRLNCFLRHDQPCVRLGYREAQARGIRP